MKFKSYCEIENSYNEKKIRQAREMGFTDPSVSWVVETKIDGSNFQCSIDENDKFIVGTRSHFLGREENFQGYERAMRNEEVELKLRQMKNLIKSILSDQVMDMRLNELVQKPFILTVYGELCGGMYRHPDVEKVKGAQKVQGRIDYHPDNMWVPFDIVIRNEDNTIVDVFHQTDVYRYCKDVGLPYPIIKYYGTFDDCLAYQNDFIDDTGHILWGLPLIDGNIAEGVVIKPNKALWFNNGERVIFKNKNDKFKERTCKAPKEPKEIIPMNDLERKYYELAREFITENRLMSVFSKIGEVNEKGFGMILGSFLKDLWNDFDKEYREEIQTIEKETTIDQFNFSKARKEISKEVAEFIRPMFIKKLNS